MNRDTWDKAQDLIAEALDLSPPAREILLEARCADPALRAEIRSYLRTWDEMPTGFLEHAGPMQSFENSDLPIGTQVGPYLVVDVLGRGGMGQVFLGQDVRLHRKVALKRLLAPGQNTEGERALILSEARAAAQINHPNVATVHDIIEHETRTFIVMEYVEGETLSSMLGRERISLDRVVDIGRQLASALVAAHAKGVIHRDVKPANIQVTADASAKILDFGIAAATAASTTVSSDGLGNETGHRQPGTLGYMSPEQMLNHRIDARSDAFSLGLVLFEMATGERAYPTQDRQELEASVLRPLRRADAVNRQVPRRLADLIAKALEVDPLKRIHSVEMVKTLERLHNRYFVARVLRQGARHAVSTFLWAYSRVTKI